MACRSLSRSLFVRFATVCSSIQASASFLHTPFFLARGHTRMNLSDDKMMRSSWSGNIPEHVEQAKNQLRTWPLDEYNTKLLDEVHPKSWKNEKACEDSGEGDIVYDFIAIGAGAGGLVSSRQSARRGAKSVMISAKLAGGDCLNVGCVPSKALIRCARMAREVKKAKEDDEFGINIAGDVEVDFGKIMQRMRKLRAEIAPIDGHTRGEEIGVKVIQGFARFVSADTVEVLSENGEGNFKLRFKKAAICTGGRASMPEGIPGLDKVPYTTNETLFNLTKLPNRMVVLGSGVVALEMAQTFATFGAKVTVLVRSKQLFPLSDPDAGPLLQKALEENSGIEFLTEARIIKAKTLEEAKNHNDFPLIKLEIKTGEKSLEMECECLLIAAGRTPNVENLNLEAANIDYDPKQGIIVDDNARSVTNPNVYSVGDCTAGVPRLTHMSGEMAKVVVQNSLFDDDWKLSSLVVPSCMYTEPEFASVGKINSPLDEVDIFTASFEHNDRSILDGEKEGYVKIFCTKGTGKIVGCTIIGSRAGELINEVSLAIKHDVPLEGIGRNIHCYPTTGESIMGCGIQLINTKWKMLK